MKRISLSVLFVVAMVILLATLAVLQYLWLGQISDGERERLQSRLQADTRRFADEFNHEIQGAYFNFKLPGEYWERGDWTEFSERYGFWQSRTQYPDLISEFWHVDLRTGKTMRYDSGAKAFEASDLPADLAPLRSGLGPVGEVPAVAVDQMTLVMPLNDFSEPIGRIVERVTLGKETMPASQPKRIGYLLIRLNAKYLRETVFDDLRLKYFADPGTTFDLSVTDLTSRTVFATNPVSVPDSTARLLDLAPERASVFFTNRDLVSTGPGIQRSVVFSTTTHRIERRAGSREPKPNSNSNVSVQVLTDDIRPRVEVFEKPAERATDSPWTLNVQHTSGSLENFIASTRRKNLAISFGILSLLGASVMFIFLSARRAQTFAQRQVDFVSSVSHEFRTPLAVICSASENLADGVAREPDQVTRYGELIKGEGRKLSSMVEQILEFAGARSGRRRFDFQDVAAGEIVASAIGECRPMLDEKGFAVETRIAPDLPVIRADRNALAQAIQNLIVNALKYSDGSRWIRIEADRTDDGVAISVIDRGIGIEPKELGKIFEPFYRSKTVVDEQIHGNGLGLSLVRETVEAHGGSVMAESKPGEGSRFVIRLRA